MKTNHAYPVRYSLYCLCVLYNSNAVVYYILHTPYYIRTPPHELVILR
jgi:hypothetical protein